MELKLFALFAILLIGAGAGFIQRVSGFGLGIFAMLFLPYFMPVHTAATISCLFSCGTSTHNAVKNRKHIPFKIILPLVLISLITVPVAVRCSVLISGDLFEKILGIILVCLSIYFVFFDNRIKVRPTLTNSLIAGGVGGALNGLFSTGGPPVVLYLTNALPDKMQYFAGIQFYFAATNIYATVIRVISGVISPGILLNAVVGFAGCMAGNVIGKLVFDKLNSKKLKMVIYICMIISGIIMFF